MSAGPTHVSSKIRLTENPGSQSLITRISASTKDRTVEDTQTENADTAQRAGSNIDCVAPLLCRLADAE
ncbi:hypothetical protein PTTG_29401 [Puccinia triticina 1-1 BBBD Race 1]|uniref:Uncharacterized protein n=1 Tax=Puccinia triticina (isolate 1-1 / race 1 (BBBD)) TaxID=630390 RepID=A0A180G4C4_PUCT1|nr:hypothetical protein PTTG_29401 [Puccinia triticina 1-1 BBBD Race 1]